MPLFPPSLDTRRWPDLVAEALALLPLESARWTDHNVSDPGIALIELLASLVDTDVYRASRVTDRHRRKLLALLGAHPRGPRPARVPLVVRPGPGAPTTLPAGLGLVAHAGATGIGLETVEPLTPSGATVVAVAVDTGPADTTDPAGPGWTELTGPLLAGGTEDAFGPDPAPGAALALGLDRPLKPGTTLCLWPAVVGPDPDADPEDVGRDHHDARTVWEFRVGGAWRPLPSADVEDPTRALTRAGTVRLRLGAGLPVEPLGTLGEHAWLRCRLDQGRHDAPPRVGRIVADVVQAAVSTTAVGAYDVAPSAVVEGGADLVAGAVVALAVTADPSGVLRTVRAGAAAGDAAPTARVLAWTAPTAATPGRLAAELVVAGVGDGAPEQCFRLPPPRAAAEPGVITPAASTPAGGAAAGGAVGDAPGTHAVVAEDTFVWLVDPRGGVEEVRLVPDLDASGRRDLHAVLDPVARTLSFGDGRAGRVPEDGRTVVASYRTTPGARGGLLAPPAPVAVASDLRTTVLLGGVPDPGAMTVGLVEKARGAADAEDTAAAAARTERLVWAHERLADALAAAAAESLDDLPRADVRRLAVPERAVTLAGVERCALATPGTRISRVRAFAETDPRLPGLRAAGCVTVVVVPWLPRTRPEPTDGLLRAVRRHLAGLRTVGTRFFVTGPRYLVVHAEVSVALLPGADPAAVAAGVRAALDSFLHPVTGGPHGTGWPFGRDVYRAEVMGVVDAVPGVDHVTALALRADDGPPVCGGLCVPAAALVLSGSHAVAATPPEPP
ncbi:MAG TPA: hypothetical protein VLH10_13040 [Yinghuangia sp.]|nr:hypothetical protein [Yinghuangia sp.]